MMHPYNVFMTFPSAPNKHAGRGDARAFLGIAQFIFTERQYNEGKRLD